MFTLQLQQLSMVSGGFCRHIYELPGESPYLQIPLFYNEIDHSDKHIAEKALLKISLGMLTGIIMTSDILMSLVEESNCPKQKLY